MNRLGQVLAQTLGLGIQGSLCYLHAIFAMERAYTAFYLVYLAILSSTFF